MLVEREFVLESVREFQREDGRDEVTVAAPFSITIYSGVDV